MKVKILIIEDEQAVSEALKECLDHMGYDAFTANNEEDGLHLIKKEQPELVLLDLNLPRPTGMELLRQVKGSARSNDRGREPFNQPDSQSPPVFIILTQFGDIPTTVQAMKLGAFDFIPKPYSVEHLEVVIKKAELLVRQHCKISTLLDNIDKPVFPVRSTNENMLVVEKTIRQVASGDQSALVLGETGTGKEEAAHAIHRLSSRSAGPFVPVNCSAIPETLFEDEMFGHEKGAFHGADSQKLGYFEEASGGTLFLDEVGDMSLSSQAKVLRALQEQKIRRLGRTKLIPVDIRVIAATSKDLEQAIEQRSFRRDLYYRLAGEEITLPSLRDRKEDLPALTDYFLNNLRLLRVKKDVKLRIGDAAREILLLYHWPGNVRELINVLGRAANRCSGDTIMSEHLLIPLSKQQSTEDDAGIVVGRVHTKGKKTKIARDIFLAVWKESNENVGLAAQRLRRSTRTVHRMIREYIKQVPEAQSP